MKFMALFFPLALLTSCSGQTSHEETKPPGEVVMIQGTAVNTKLSAAVKSASMLVYCIEIPEWPEDVVGRVVSASGRLEKSDQFKARTGPGGDRSAGTAGGDYLLRAVSWRVE
jgi:hypothetical protein